MRQSKLCCFMTINPAQVIERTIYLAVQESHDLAALRGIKVPSELLDITSKEVTSQLLDLIECPEVEVTLNPKSIKK